MPPVFDLEYATTPLTAARWQSPYRSTTRRFVAWYVFGVRLFVFQLGD